MQVAVGADHSDGNTTDTARGLTDDQLDDVSVVITRLTHSWVQMQHEYKQSQKQDSSQKSGSRSSEEPAGGGGKRR